MLNILFDGATEGWIEVVYGEPGQQPSQFIELSSVDAVNWPADCDVYFSPALRRSQGSTKEDVLGTRVLWADIDRLKPPLAVLPPTFEVFSGNGWHYYWLLEDWNYDIEQIESANKILRDSVDGDDCWNVNRLLRIPSTTNYKNGSPKLCFVQTARPHIYTIDDCLAVGKLKAATVRKILTGFKPGIGTKSRSEFDFAVVRQLVGAGFSLPGIKSIFANHKIGDKYREEGDDYLERTISSASESAKRERKPTEQPDKAFTERHDGYYVIRGKNTRRVSTFILDPILLLEGTEPADSTTRNPDAILCNVRVSSQPVAESNQPSDSVPLTREWPGVTFTRSAFTSRFNLDKECQNAEWQWLGRDDDVRELLPYLLDRLKAKGYPKVWSVATLGLHKRDSAYFYVGQSTTLGEGGVFDRQAAPVVYLDSKRERPAVDFHIEEPSIAINSPNSIHIGGSLETGVVADISSLLPMLNAPEAIWPVIGWYSASPFKPVLEQLGVRFPVLNIFGTKGSGKTTTILRIFQPLFCNTRSKTYDANTTRFVTLSLLGATNCYPVAFSEFRQGAADKILRYILLAYDSGSDPRGRADQTTIDYPLTSPFSVDGEDGLSDPACKERIIAVQFHPSSIEEGASAWTAHLKIQKLESSFNSWGTSYLKFCLEMLNSSQIAGLLEQAKSEIQSTLPQTLPDRVRSNLSVCWFGCKMWSHFTGLELPQAIVLEASLSQVWNQKAGRTLTLADEFVEDLLNHLTNTQARFAGIPWTVRDDILYFQYAPAYSWWARLRKVTNQGQLSKDSIRQQLGELPYATPPKLIANRWMHGINMQDAFDGGLDIKQEIHKSTEWS